MNVTITFYNENELFELQSDKEWNAEARFVHVLHNLSVVDETGSPAPVFPKNSNVSYFLENNFIKRFLEGASRH